MDLHINRTLARKNMDGCGWGEGGCSHEVCWGAPMSQNPSVSSLSAPVAVHIRNSRQRRTRSHTASTGIVRQKGGWGVGALVEVAVSLGLAWTAPEEGTKTIGTDRVVLGGYGACGPIRYPEDV